MGAWGPGIFSNDAALDVRETYVGKLKMGATDEEALSFVQAELSDYLDDEEDAIDFWLCLSSILFDYGRLTDEVKDKALSIIEKGDDFRWEKYDLKKRAKALSDLKEKLLSKQPERKKVSVMKPVVCKYKPGDILLYKPAFEGSEKKAYHDWFFYILIDEVAVFDTRLEGLGDTYPIIYIKYSDHELTDLAEIDACGFINTGVRGINEHRIQLYRDGYSGFIKACQYLGNYDFARIENTYDDSLFIMRPAREIDGVISSYLDGLTGN